MVADLIARLRGEIQGIHLAEVDITREPEVAVKYRIMATPAIAINGKLEFMGVPREEVLRETIAQHAKLLKS